MVRMDVTLVCVFLPLILGAPVEDALKQQISSGLFRNDGYWNMMAPGKDGNVRPLRSRLDSLAGQTFGAQKRFDSLSGSTFGNQKRNFDEIDRAGFGSFVKKNFDEIDRVGLGFNKRNFDEIDRTGFGSFVKRST